MRYINPGYAELLDVDGGTTIEDATYNPLNGVAFTQPTDNDGVNFGSTVNELYGKFDIYLPPLSDLPTDYFAKVGIFKPGNTNAGFNGVAISKYSSSYINLKAFVCGSSDKTVTNRDVQFNFGSIHHFFFYFKARGESKADGEYFIYMNGIKVMEGKDKWIYMDNASRLVIYAASVAAPISNIILSNSPIDMRERITPVPLGTPVTDMVDRGDGSYLAESAGQQILQTVDVASLITNFGGASQVTGIAVAGNPAYRTAEGLTSLIGISKVNGTQTEHGTKMLRTSTTAGAIDCHAVDITLSEMVGMQLGWKAGV